MANNHRLLLLLTILCALLIVGGFYGLGYHYYVAPATDKMKELEDEVQIQNQALQRIESGADATNRPETSGALQLKLPIDKEIDQILVMLEGIAESTGVSLKELVEIQETEEKAGEQEDSEALAEIDSFAYELQGESEQYEAVDNFLQLLEKDERLLKVNHLEMTADENGFAFTVHIQAFYAPDLDGLLKESPKSDPTTEMDTKPI
ncbi:hypothetical protein ERJ70_12070 [Sediminibacillus dalangtanensis]|uniref:Pilus assembly protein PilO n=1 Tax=Sediminibacillus dalangtanensis TaxID=2729421 RepID=A0ABX7VSN3_9BACI|nr:hypothetical protein [Sediminibacillus dalangtanensis]QTM99962.1 hypothetical protein ERJ70_12070 [Sediminibacillus dalangtanensis]